MRDIKELDIIDRLTILLSSGTCIMAMSFVAAVLLFVLDIPQLVMFMMQNIINDNIKLLIIWLWIATFSIVLYTLFELMKTIWFHIKRIHYLIKNDIIKVVVGKKIYYMPRSSAIDAMISYMESERKNEEKKTSEENI